MLDDDILYQEQRLTDFRTRAFLSALRHLFFYAFAWFILFASVCYGFYSGNYRKENIFLQCVMVLVGIAFAWLMFVALRNAFNYAREGLFPIMRIYKRRIQYVNFLSTDNPMPRYFMGIEWSSRKYGQVLYLDEPINNQASIKVWELPKSHLKKWLLAPEAKNADIFIVMGLFSKRIWDIRKKI